MNTSQDYYNKIANNYRSIADKRLAYTNSIDEIIIKNNPACNKYLDIGAGDGIRSLKIAKSINANTIVLLDNSKNITDKIKNTKNIKIINQSILDYTSPYFFNLITCLWNVLGHVGDSNQRLSFFKKIKQLLTKEGKLILDVNNRYNISAYGYKNVMQNLSYDLTKNTSKGYFNLNKGDDIETNVYIHAPLEIEQMCKKCNLKVVQTFFIDYDTGIVKNTFFEGQILYIIKHAK